MWSSSYLGVRSRAARFWLGGDCGAEGKFLHGSGLRSPLLESWVVELKLSKVSTALTFCTPLNI